MLDDFKSYRNINEGSGIRDDRETYCTYEPAEPAAPEPAPPVVEPEPTAEPPPTPSAPAFVTFLGPARSLRGGVTPAAFKVHRRSLRPGETIETEGYGKATRFRVWHQAIESIDDLLPVLEDAQALNVFLIRGQLPAIYAERGLFCERKKRGNGGSIDDVCNRLVCIDIDSEPLPDDIDDPFDLLAVGDSIRAKLPAPLSAASCIVQASGSYGMWEYGRPRVIKLHLFFILSEGLDEATWRAWIKQQNKTGRYPAMDASVAGVVQPIYIAKPRFEDGLRDPVPQRLALLYGEQDEVNLALSTADLEALKPVAMPTVTLGTAGTADGGEQAAAPGLLQHLARRLQTEAVGEGNRHTAILAICFQAGGYVASGAFSFEEAAAALVPIAVATGSAGADRAVLDSLRSGMSRPLAVPTKQWRGREDDEDSEDSAGSADDDSSEPDDRLRDKNGNVLPAKPEPLPSTAPLVAAIDDIGEILHKRTIQFFNGARENAVTEPEEKRAPLSLAIFSTTGAGKTHRTLQVAKELGVDVMLYAPTLALGEEIVSRTLAGQPPPDPTLLLDLTRYDAAIIRGRLSPRPGAEDGVLMCDRPGLIKRFRAAKVSGSEEKLFCIHRTRSGGIQSICPLYRQCAYQRQAPAQLTVLTHAYLTLPAPAIIRDVATEASVIDESPLSSLIYRRSVKLETVLMEAEQPGGPVIVEIAQRLAARESMRTIVLSIAESPEKLAAVGEWMATVPVPPQPETEAKIEEMDAAKRIDEADALCDPRVELSPLVAGLVRAIEGQPDVIQFVAEHASKTRRDEHGKPISLPAVIQTAFVREPKMDGDRLLLDATGSESIARAMMGDDMEVLRVEAPQPANPVVQVTDSRFSMKQLQSPLLRTQIVVWLNALPYKRIGLVSHKGFIAAIAHRLPGNVITLNFGALRGIDSMKDCDCLVVIGRTEPRAQAILDEARAIWPDGRLPEAAEYHEFASPLTLRNGCVQMVRERAFDDPHLNEVLSLHREAELIQAIGRLRAHRGDGAAPIFILGSTPVPGWAPDVVVKTDDLLPRWSLASVAEALNHDCIPLDAHFLVKRLPERFAEPKDAENWARGVRQNGWATLNSLKEYIYLLSDSGLPTHFDAPYEGYNPVGYRVLAAQLGAKRKAWEGSILVPARMSDREALERAGELLGIAVQESLPAAAAVAKAVQENPGASVAEIARLAGVNKSTAQQYCKASPQPKAERNAERLAEMFAAEESNRSIAKATGTSEATVRRARWAWVDAQRAKQPQRPPAAEPPAPQPPAAPTVAPTGPVVDCISYAAPSPRPSTRKPAMPTAKVEPIDLDGLSDLAKAVWRYVRIAPNGLSLDELRAWLKVDGAAVASAVAELAGRQVVTRTREKVVRR